MNQAGFAPLTHYLELPAALMQQRAAEFLAEVQRRRSVRQFSNRPVPREVIEDCLRAAGTAPSGANMQPWHFVVVETPGIKRQIREAADREELAFYQHRASPQWLADLAPLGTNASKPFLESAPCLIVVFAQLSGRTPQGEVRKHYYAVQSTGIAVGMLITAIHHAGLVCLPYTPSRMTFLNGILARPPQERPLVVLVTGYPAEDAVVPQIERKTLQQIASFI